jgi:hypothetical protein
MPYKIAGIDVHKRPLRQISPERHRRFSFLRTQFSELSTTGPYFLPLRTTKRARARVSRI